MENWLPAIPLLIGIVGLWWKVSKDMANMATKQDIQSMETRLQADIRELRQMIVAHISDHNLHDARQNNP